MFLVLVIILAVGCSSKPSKSFSVSKWVKIEELVKTCNALNCLVYKKYFYFNLSTNQTIYG